MPREARWVRYASRRHLGTGSDSFVFAIRTEKSLLRSKSELKYFNWFNGLQILSWIDYLIGGSPAQSGCPSLNKRRLPRLASPSETLRQRIDLIVMAAGKRQQLGNKLLQPRGVLGQKHRAALEQIDLSDEALLLVSLRFVIDDVDVLFAQGLDQAVADATFLDHERGRPFRSAPSPR